MKKNTIIYWTSTGIIALMMAFSAYSYLAKPEMAAAFKHLGFPDYLRLELAAAKFLGVSGFNYSTNTGKGKRVGLCRLWHYIYFGFHCSPQQWRPCRYDFYAIGFSGSTYSIKCVPA